MPIPVCTKDAPYRGNRSSHHPESGPKEIDERGHVILWCPNCGQEWKTVLTEADLDNCGVRQ